MQSSPPPGIPLPTETQQRFVWIERFGLPFTVCLMEAVLATAPLAFFAVFGNLSIPLLGPATYGHSIPLALAETVLLILGMLVVAFSFYALAVAVERWHAGVQGWWVDIVIFVVYAAALSAWVIFAINCLPDYSVIWYMLAICWIAWRIVRIVHLGQRELETLKVFIDSTFRGGLGVLLGIAVFSVVSAAPTVVFVAMAFATVLFILSGICAIPLTHFVIACRAGAFPVTDEAYARAIWMRIVLPMMATAAIIVTALALIGVFQWHPVHFSLFQTPRAHMIPTSTPAQGTPQPGNGQPSPGHGLPSPGNGTQLPGHGSPSPGNGTPSPGNGTQLPGNGTGTPVLATATPGYGTPGSNGTPGISKTHGPGTGTPTAGASTGTPGAGVAGQGTPMAGETGTPIHAPSTPGSGASGGGPRPHPTPTPTVAEQRQQMTRQSTINTALIILLIALLLVVAALLILLSRRQHRETATELLLEAPEAPVEEDPPFPDTVRAYYRAILQAAVDARSDLARRSFETPTEYEYRLRQFLATPDGARVLQGSGADAGDVETALSRLTAAYQMVRYRGETDPPTTNSWLRGWLPTLRHLFKRPPRAPASHEKQR